MASRKLATWSVVCFLVAGPATGRALGRLEPLPGSPFLFEGSGRFEIPVLTPGGGLLAVSSGEAAEIATFMFDAEGAPSLVGRFPSPAPSGTLGGMAFTSSGHDLFAVAQDAINVHEVLPGGELVFRVAKAAGRTPSLPLDGVATTLHPSTTFLYVNDAGEPATVSGYHLLGRAPPYYQASYPTGAPGARVPPASRMVAAPTIASAGYRLFVLNQGSAAAGVPSSISVLDSDPGGLATLATGSPYELYRQAVSLAVDETGQRLYVGGARGSVVVLEVARDGQLTEVGFIDSLGLTTPVVGLAVDPSGRWLAYTAPAEGRLVVFDAVAFEPVEGGLVGEASIPGPDSAPWPPAGLAWDRSGRLYVAHAGDGPALSVYRVVAPAPPGVACRGLSGMPWQLEAEPSACGLTVDAASGLVGSCTPSPAGLASCTLDGGNSVFLPRGLSQVLVQATAPDGLSSSCVAWLYVQDTTPPQVTVRAHPTVIWPPDHRLVPIHLAVRAVDACGVGIGPTCEVTSSQPDATGLPRDLAPDVVWRDGRLLLRAERSGNVDRVYTITCTARGGPYGSGTAQVVVPGRRR